MKLDRLAIIDCEWAPSCQLYHSPQAGSVDLIEWAVINMDFDPHSGWIETGRVHGLVQYLAHLPQRIQKLTGIDAHQLKVARPFDEWVQDIELYTKDRVLVGHHIEQDYKVLQEHFERVGKSFQREIFCTLKEAKKQWPKLASYELNELAQLFDLPHEQHHRALSDAKACWLLFEKWKTPSLPTTQSKASTEEDFKDFPWLSHESRDKIKTLPKKAGIISFYSHKKLLHVCACLNLKSEALKEMQKLKDSPWPLTQIKLSSHPHLLINQVFTLELRRKYSPHLDRFEKNMDDYFAISCFKNKSGLLSLKTVKYKKENHHRYIDYAQNKNEALHFIKRIEEQFEQIPSFAYIDPEELKSLHDKANKQRQLVINQWKERFNGRYEYAGKALVLKTSGEMEILEQTQKGPMKKIIRPHIEHILNVRKLRHQFQKLLSEHSLRDGHNQNCPTL